MHLPRPLLLALLTHPLLALLAAPAASANEVTEPFVWKDVERIVVLGDIHGQYQQMVDLLEAAALVDDDLGWTGASAHLVLLGDLIDRGGSDRAVLDLARRLQHEAEQAGGAVHVLLGNHEVMNLAGDFRYVTREGFADFARDESAGDREEALQNFRRSKASRGVRRAELAAAFDEHFPPGSLARSRAFAPDGEYGEWLLRQPAVIRLNERLFVHGGLTTDAAQLNLREINRRVRAGIEAYHEHRHTLLENGRVDWPFDFRSIVKGARDLVEEAGGRRGARPRGGSGEAAWLLLEATEGLAFAPAGPVWYRGVAIENERVEQRNLERVLRRLDAVGMVVAHTPTRRGEPTSRFGGKVLRTDVGMGYGREGRALVLEGKEVHALMPDSSAPIEVAAEAPQGEGWPPGEGELPDATLERFLSSASVREVTPADFGIPVELLVLEDGGMRLRAVFGHAQESEGEARAAGRSVPRRYQNTIAAYRLDRLLGLEQVPVTVPRRVRGQRGLVQVWLESAWDQGLVERYEAWSSLQGLDQELAEAEVFSALIGVVDRVPAGRMFLPQTRRIVLADNSVSFSPDTRLTSFLPDGCGPIGPALLASLRALRRDQLEAQIGDLVSSDALDAVLTRRDRLVEQCEEPATDWSIEKILQRIVGE